MSKLISQNARKLTAAQFQQLSDVPPEMEWFANIDNKHPRAAYQNDVRNLIFKEGKTLSTELNDLSTFKLLALLYCLTCFWGLLAPFVGYSFLDLESVKHILKWDTHEAIYVPHVIFLYLKEILYFLGGILIFFMKSIGRLMLVFMITVEMILSVLMGISVASNVDLFMGLVNGLLLGAILSLAYFSELKRYFQ